MLSRVKAQGGRCSSTQHGSVGKCPMSGAPQVSTERSTGDYEAVPVE